MAGFARMTRISREIKNFETKPPWGIVYHSCEDDDYSVLNFSLQGPKGTPYENGSFKLEVTIPEKYPFEPPLIRFITPVYHPNIDKGGRICMDTLKMPPTGAWRPTITLESLMISLQTLLANPNMNNPLVLEIAQEAKLSIDKFHENAKKHTEDHAMLKVEK